MNNRITLDSLPEGKRAKVDMIELTGTMRRRLQDLGLIEGTCVECLHKSITGDPTAFLIRGAAIAIRKADSSKVMIKLS